MVRIFLFAVIATLFALGKPATAQQLDGGYRVVMVITLTKTNSKPFIESKMTTDTFLTAEQCQAVAEDRAMKELQIVNSIIAGRQIVANIDYKCAQPAEITQITQLVGSIHQKFGWSGK